MDHEPSRFGRAGRPGSRRRPQSDPPLDVFDVLFSDAPAPPESSPGCPPPMAARPLEGRRRPEGCQRLPGFPREPTPSATAPPLEHVRVPPAPIRPWWDDPRDRRPLPDRSRAHETDDWPRPVIPSHAPRPPYDGCRWPRACALLGRRVSCVSLLPCRCPGGATVTRALADSRRR